MPVLGKVRFVKGFAPVCDVMFTISVKINIANIINIKARPT